MNRIKKIIILYFNLSRKEANGFIFLCLLMIILIFTPAFYSAFPSKEDRILDSDKKTMDSLISVLNELHSHEYPKVNIKGMQLEKIIYSHFNPNSSSEETMSAAGVPKYISKRIVKFRDKGGKFKTKDDLRKIYGLKEKDYQTLYPYVNLPETIEVFHSKQKNELTEKIVISKKAISHFDINTTDSTQLIQLKGIGSTLANRILKYKEKLGGFISTEQFKEIYGLDSVAIKELLLHAIIQNDYTPKKVNINSLTLSLLASHPYIGKKTAQLIINYHNQHGKFNSINELKNIKLITEGNYLKMLPYLSLE